MTTEQLCYELTREGYTEEELREIRELVNPTRIRFNNMMKLGVGLIIANLFMNRGKDD